ncbi:MAG TPA: bifunctional aldolase/short-chain dehydrogenase [Acidimicrobiia bacterium]|nr:bifunctional aldolase/short-chain dehydrogenase [Acidimicrobiia bacterium]
MESLWRDSEASAFAGPLAECVYGSRLIGSDPSLVLHGGGNTSVKGPYRDITGSEIDALYVKGSGWDLATIEAEGFTALRRERLSELLALPSLSDADMMRELLAARLDPEAPAPSVESLLHAFLPYPAVQHSHADVIVTLTNLEDGAERVRKVYGDTVVIVPYVMPGFDLARAVAGMWEEAAGAGSQGMVLMNHGLFTFGDTTRVAYERHVELIDRAERWLDDHAPLPAAEVDPLPSVDPVRLASLRREISEAAGRPMVMSRHADADVAGFVRRPDLASLASRGPLTPDHVIRTKRHPMVGDDVAEFVESYRDYFADLAHRARTELTMLDPAPRVVVDPELGLLTVGESARAADIAADIYRHTIPVLQRSEDHLGGYQALSAGDLFDCEYWDLEQAKLRRGGPPPELGGMVAVVTGAASGIGHACAAALLERGCAVAGLDVAPSIATAFEGPAWLGLNVDVTDPDAQGAALAAVVERFGGLDVLVSSAGMFGTTAPVAERSPAEWKQVQALNFDAVADLLAASHPLLQRSPVGGRVVVVGSRNVAAPGPGAAAYSASKAAVTQLARVAALEWAADGIRVNVVHPDAVFDTGLWTDELVAARAARYDMTVEEYKTRNLLSVEVTSAMVGEAVAALCSNTFAATTGAQIPIDGGSERVV